MIGGETEVSMTVPVVIGAAVGAAVGFFFHRFVGCRSGTCPIASNRALSIVYWAVLGGLAANLFK
jgi:hypothetical protein